MKFKFLVLGLSILTLVFVNQSCNSDKKKEQTGEQVEKKDVIYTCSMHPEVIKHEPGKCPKCGMELIEKK